MSNDGNLRPLFRQYLPDLHWQSIESGMTGGGIPDSNYCHAGVEGWIEFKRTNAYAVQVRPAQVGWILRRLRGGGRVTVGVRQTMTGGPRKGLGADVLWLIKGSAIKTLHDCGLRHFIKHTDGILFRGTGGPTHWDWQRVQHVLLNA